MNIFVLDKDPVLAAQYLCDKRVKHMPKECIELLSIYIHSITDKWLTPFPLWSNGDRTDTHFIYNSPTSKWVKKDKANMTWLYSYTVALLDEYEYRFNEVSSMSNFLIKLRDELHFVDQQPKSFHNSSFFKDLEIVTAYRKTICIKWYELDAIKAPRWTGRDVPYWIKEFKYDVTTKIY